MNCKHRMTGGLAIYINTLLASLKRASCPEPAGRQGIQQNKKKSPQKIRRIIAIALLGSKEILNNLKVFQINIQLKNYVLFEF